MKPTRHFPVSTATLSLTVSVTLTRLFRTSSWGSRLTLSRLHPPSPACPPPVLRAPLSLFATVLVHALLTAAAASHPPSLKPLPLQQPRWMQDPVPSYFAALMVLVDLGLVETLLDCIAVRSSGVPTFPFFGEPPPMTLPGSYDTSGPSFIRDACPTSCPAPLLPLAQLIRTCFCVSKPFSSILPRRLLTPVVEPPAPLYTALRPVNHHRVPHLPRPPLYHLRSLRHRLPPPVISFTTATRGMMILPLPSLVVFVTAPPLPPLL